MRLLKGGKTALKVRPLTDEEKKAALLANPMELLDNDGGGKADKSEKGEKEKREEKLGAFEWKRDGRERLINTETDLHKDANQFLDAVG